MHKRQLVRSACLCVVLATTSTSLFAQSGRMHNRRVAANDLSRDEKHRTHDSRKVIDSRSKSAADVTLKDEPVKPTQQETKQTQEQRWTDQDVVSIVIITALVLIVFVGLKRT